MKNILIFVILGLICGFGLYTCEKNYEQMDKYAIEHNCKWDYNDMCYTREQKPWLFND